LEGGDGVRIGEEPVVSVAGGAPGCIENPPGGLQGDPTGIGEVHGADAAVVDDVGDLAVGAVVDFGPLPKTSTGKIQKYVLRDREWAGLNKRIN